MNTVNFLPLSDLFKQRYYDAFAVIKGMDHELDHELITTFTRLITWMPDDFNLEDYE